MRNPFGRRHAGDMAAGTVSIDGLLHLLRPGMGATLDLTGTVDEATAMTLSAWYRGKALVAGTIAQLPLKTYKTTGERGDNKRVEWPSFIDEPHPDLTKFEWVEQIVGDLIDFGDAYHSIEKDGAGRPKYLHPLQHVTPRWATREDGGLYDELRPVKVFNLSGSTRNYTSKDILQIKGFGLSALRGESVVALASRSLSLSIAQRQFAEAFYTSGALMSGILKHPDEIDGKQARELRRRFMQSLGLKEAGGVVVVGGGADFIPTSVIPVDAQMIELAQFGVQEVARWLGLPPVLLAGQEATTSWGTGVQAMTQNLVVFTLAAITRRIEQRLTRLLPPGVHAEFELDGLLRGTPTERWAVYKIAAEVKALTINEIRAFENMPPVAWGAKPFEAATTKPAQVMSKEDAAQVQEETPTEGTDK